MVTLSDIAPSLYCVQASSGVENLTCVVTSRFLPFFLPSISPPHLSPRVLSSFQLCISFFLQGLFSRSPFDCDAILFHGMQVILSPCRAPTLRDLLLLSCPCCQPSHYLLLSWCFFAVSPLPPSLLCSLSLWAHSLAPSIPTPPPHPTLGDALRGRRESERAHVSESVRVCV